MSSSQIVIKDANSANLSLAADASSGVTTPYHLEDVTQRAALLAALAALTPATGLATAALQTTGNTSLASILTALGGTLAVSGPLTAAQLTGAALATSALQTTGNTSLNSILTALTGALTVVGPLTLTQLASALLKADTVVQSTSASRSTTVGTTAQVLMPANTSRRGFSLQNQSSVAVYISGIGTATADNNCLMVAAGTYYESPPHHSGTGAISIISTAASTPIYSREW